MKTSEWSHDGMRILTILFGIGRAHGGLGRLWCTRVSRVEEPPYLLDTSEDIEIRLYDPYRVAEVTVSGDYKAASSRGFPEYWLATFLVTTSSSRKWR